MQDMPGTSGAQEIRPHVLLVEDYEASIFLSGMLLEEFGYSFDIARNGLEAVSASMVRRYGVILMDVQMPGIDGLEATRRIRAFEAEQNLPPTPILAMTAHAFEEDRRRCLAAGMDDCLTKPFTPDALSDKISRMLAHAAARNPAERKQHAA